MNAVKERNPTLTTGWRKLLLTVHLVVSVGLVGADISVIILGLAGLTSGVPELIRASYISMELLVSTVLLPLTVAALFTGILLGLGTSWGLVRYYWVLTKLVLTILTLNALIFLLRPAIAHAAAEALAIPLSELTGAYPLSAGFAAAIRPVIALIILLVIIMLAIYKPWGRTGIRFR